MEGIKIGIGRVSTKDQNPQRQIEAFKKEGIEDRYIFIDKCSGNGGNLDKREEKKSCFLAGINNLVAPKLGGIVRMEARRCRLAFAIPWANK